MENKWSPNAFTKIKEIKKTILKKKIMLNFIIDSYAWWDRAYRWGHITVATLSPFFGVITIAAEDSSTMKVITIIVSAVAAGMLKFKEYIKFGELRDTAKQQTVKYSQLFERIEREMIKPDIKKQSEDEFIYWINREFSQVELSDPELSYSDKQKFLALCKLQNIPYDEDLDALQILMKETADDLVEIVVDKATDVIADTVIDVATDVPERKNNVEDTTNDTDDNTLTVVAHLPEKPDLKTDDDPTHTRESSDSGFQPTTHRVLSLHGDPKQLKRDRAASDKRQHDKYKDTLKKMDPKADMRWTMERLSNLGEDE